MIVRVTQRRRAGAWEGNMTSQDAGSTTRFPVLPAGWVVAVVVVVLAYLAKPDDELGFAIVVGSISAVMAYWTFRTGSRAAAIVSLVLGALWTLLFGGYAIANLASDDEVELLIQLADVLAVIGGLMILWGAFTRLRAARRRA